MKTGKLIHKMPGMKNFMISRCMVISLNFSFNISFKNYPWLKMNSKSAVFVIIDYLPLKKNPSLTSEYPDYSWGWVIMMCPRDPGFRTLCLHGALWTKRGRERDLLLFSSLWVKSLQDHQGLLFPFWLWVLEAIWVIQLNSIAKEVLWTLKSNFL